MRWDCSEKNVQSILSPLSLYYLIKLMRRQFLWHQGVAGGSLASSRPDEALCAPPITTDDIRTLERRPGLPLVDSCYRKPLIGQKIDLINQIGPETQAEWRWLFWVINLNSKSSSFHLFLFNNGNASLFCSWIRILEIHSRCFPAQIWPERQ